MVSLPDVFVGNIGLSSLTLCGEKCSQYLTLPDSRFVRGCVIVECGTEQNLVHLLQSLIDKSIPFESSYKSDPARAVLLYRTEGRISGEIIRFDWGTSGATYTKD
jgi:hypothetical protein